MYRYISFGVDLCLVLLATLFVFAAREISTFLRPTRLYELPQLFKISRRDMSYVGSRSLLPRDQPAECLDRLPLPSGFIDWARVVGGQDTSPEDKAALDPPRFPDCDLDRRHCVVWRTRLSATDRARLA
jgi:hypothetical protein